MMIRFDDELSPELLELLPPPAKPGVGVVVDVDTGTSALVVSTCSRVWLPLTVWMVVTTCWDLLMTDVEGVPVVVCLEDAVSLLAVDVLSLEALETPELPDFDAAPALSVLEERVSDGDDVGDVVP